VDFANVPSSIRWVTLKGFLSVFRQGIKGKEEKRILIEVRTCQMHQVMTWKGSLQLGSFQS
jgi:hypothetical protein